MSADTSTGASVVNCKGTGAVVNGRSQCFFVHRQRSAQSVLLHGLPKHGPFQN